MTKPSSLHGDGINFAFFELLWSKCASEDEMPSGDKPSPILRVPDTVVFLFGLPHQWYFTSKNGGPHKDKTAILRKRRANLTLENIEEVFLTKASSRTGSVGDDKVVAYFINSKTEADLNVSLDAYNSFVDNEISCDIEYFNKETLRKISLCDSSLLPTILTHPPPSIGNFLHHGRHNKSGILQRFIAPHGGSHNSCIRAIWTPKMCILERRRTKQALHDKRFALYERAITFDGPDVHSISVPLRGTVLAGRIENICDEIVRHVMSVSAEEPQGTKSSSSKSSMGVGRMAINFKVDGNGKIWILWSNSIRLEKTEFPSQPLNMDTVVKLSSAAKLSQIPSHDAKLKLENKVSFVLCPSCGSSGTSEVFQKVPYKTVISHFDKTVEMLKSHPESHPSKVWPPEERFIRAAGGVGFGTLTNQSTMSQEALIIPPVIRHINPKLRIKGYQMYRGDPQFLQKTCDVCENCFLAYAKLTSSSFLMVLPVDPFGSDGELHYEIPIEKAKARPHNVMKSKTDQSVNKNTADATNPVERFDFGKAPVIPPAIIEPPKASVLHFFC